MPAALLWPSPVVSLLDGAPLDRPPEAIVVGLVVPFLWFLDRAFVRRRAIQALAIGLLGCKLAASAVLAAHEFCSEFRAEPPLPVSPNGWPTLC